MKKILCSIMAMILLLSFTGCYSEEREKEKEQEYLIYVQNYCWDTIDGLNEVYQYGLDNDLNMKLSPEDYNSMLHSVKYVLDQSLGFKDIDVPLKYEERHSEMEKTMHLMFYAATNFRDAYIEDDFSVFYETMEDMFDILIDFSDFMDFTMEEYNNL